MTPALNLSRRNMILTGGSAAAAVALAACSSPTDAATPPTSSETTDAGGSGADAGSATTEIAKLADIPVGGGIAASLDGQPILLAQPTAGTVVAFSAICTHQGCKVEPAATEFNCPCHQSRYDLATGEVLGGPAPRALERVTVTVDGDTVLAG
ncbi:ubiquinol-cytochrome c reductase iron-sulfur subunit [Cryobacterium ruanii]|uniref:Cytochrome bc1 complex Rieske iron-sulfur subunit n=1 Tax=Cryobacterium ruanii TaxID=1259197 RepID=A0A4R9AJR8_9MICO|nr:Rieske (2Fe-2S) protein [Cryobacterium ruanii]TFD63095.1 Rieske (2Fe-2S) protein [Cryobacterium ruanii]